MVRKPGPGSDQDVIAGPDRLEAIRRSHLHGHLGDTDLDAVVATLATALRVPMAVTNIVTPNRQTYPAEVGVGVPFTTVEDQVSFCAQVVETGRSLAVADAATHRAYRHNPLVMSGQIGSYAGEPLVDLGHVIGSVAVFDTMPRVFTEDEINVLQFQTRLAAVVLALRRAARSDPLTGLPNRALLMDRLDQALARCDRQHEMVAVLFIDVDGFKAINDRFGHAAGDRCLVEVAERIGSVIRPGDTLARLGGDEFVVLCEGVGSGAEAAAIAARLDSRFDASALRTSLLATKISIGLALGTGRSTTSEALLADADAAMYRAKRRPVSWQQATS